MAKFKVNMERLPAKLHYLTFFGGIGALWPFIPVLGRQWGISATAMGGIFAMAPMASFLISPALITVAGNFSQKKNLLLLFIALNFLCFMGLGFLSNDSKNASSSYARPIQLACDETSPKQELYLRQCSAHDASQKTRTCHHKEVRRKYFSETGTAHDPDHDDYWYTATKKLQRGNGAYEYCDVRCSIDSQSLDVCDFFDDPSRCISGSKGDSDIELMDNKTFIKFDMKVEVGKIKRNDTCLVLPVDLISFDGKRLWSSCPTGSGGQGPKSSEVVFMDNCFINCVKNSRINSVLDVTEKSGVDWASKQLWSYALLVVLALICMTGVSALADRFCFEMLNEGNSFILFGQQRAFGVIGFGFFALMAGVLMNHYSEGHVLKDYGPCFYLSCGLLIINFVVTYMWKVEESNPMGANCGIVNCLQLMYPRNFIFNAASLAIGFCMGLQTNFLFWHMEEIMETQETVDNECEQKIKLIQGLLTFIESIAGELPIYLLAPFFLKKLGHANAITITLGLLAFRFLTTSAIENPWWLLPLGLFQGPTYALFYLAVLSQGKAEGLGTHLATAILAAMSFKGIGMGIGSAVAGPLLKTETSLYTFRIFGLIALALALVHFIATLIVGKAPDYSSRKGSDSLDSCEKSESDGMVESEMKEFHKDELRKISGSSTVEWREASEASAMKKFRLLLWKNFRIQTRHKIQTVVEIVIPLVFTIALAVIRMLIPIDRITEPVIFEPINLQGTVPVVLSSLTNQIFYTPQNSYIDKLMERVNQEFFISQGLNYTFKSFPTEAKLIRAYEKSTEGGFAGAPGTNSYNATSPVLAGIVFEQFPKNKVPSNIKYKLKFPAYQRTEFELFAERFTFKPAWFTDAIYPLFRLLGPRSNKANGGFPGYYAEGFLYVQNAVDNSITKSLLNETQIKEYEEYDLKMQRFPYPPYIDDKFVFAIQFWMPFFITLSFIYPAMNITKVIVYEKECRLKEFMKMMGLPNWLHWTAWLIKTFLFLLGTLILMTLLLKVPFSEDRAVLTESNALVVITVLICHAFSLIGFCFLMSTLYSSANSAATSAGFIWLMVFLPYGFLFPRLSTLSRQSKYLTCFLLGNVPISYACQLFATFEGFEEGIQWRLITSGVSPDDSFSILDCMIMMIVNGLIYMTAAFYIEIAFPGKYGVPLPWYFVFTKWYWTGNVPVEERKFIRPMKKNLSTYFEVDPPTLKPGIEVKGLTKIFGKKTAVNNLNIKLFENQITALLGHNGAGKTTTMSMLTGLLNPSRGTAVVNGHDITSDMKSVRASLGLCPQYDVLFPELTVEEHLRFFSLLKGYDDYEAQIEIERMLRSLGFESKRNAEAHTLSGGMRRKLSVGIAFCAGSKVVLLDEPTSGMDVGARRSTWDLIQTEKVGRTVVLSTHFMEEADLLGDRISIMAEGEIKCNGSSLFLKKKYGGDYRLIIVKEDNCQVENITNILKNKIPSIELSEEVGAELSYSLPDETSREFPAIFEELERRKEELGIGSYGVGNTTLEEVFMRVGEMAAESKHGTLNKKEKSKGSRPKSTNGSTTSPTTPTTLTLDFDQVQDQDKKLLKSGDSARNTGSALKLQQLKAMLVKKFIYSLRNRNLAILQIVIPITLLCISVLAVRETPAVLAPKSHTLTLDRYEALGKTTTAIACEKNSKICNGYRSFVAENYRIEQIRDSSFLDYILQKETEDLAGTTSTYMVGFEQRSKYGDFKNKKNELVAFFNNQPFHTPPLALNMASNGILRAFNLKNKITITNHPFDYNSIDALKQSGTFFTMGFMVAWIIAFGMSFLAASFIIFPIYERVNNAKHLQYIAGVKYPIYWLAAFLMDWVNYMLPCALMLILMICMKVEDFYPVEMMMRFLVLCMAHGWCTIAFMSLMSFAFTIPSSGYARMVAFGCSTGLLSMLIVIVLDVPEFDIKDMVDTLHNVFLWIPNYALGMGIVQMISHRHLHEFCGDFDLDTFCKLSPDFNCCTKMQSSFFSWEPYGLGRNIFALMMSGIICTILLAILESRIIPKFLARFQWHNEWETGGHSVTEDDPLDDDVAAEAMRINSQTLSGLSRRDNLILRNLTKIYDGNLVAVDHLTVGVKRGETFGLLGVNGAGKTTTFKMLTGDQAPSDGDAYLCKFSIRKNTQKAFEVLGYCPQFDALVEQLTGRESIRMFARLKGIKEEAIDGIVNQLSESLLFTQHIDKQAGEYSGGNKRKLSTALAMLGNPPIIFLDEPSSGMDPCAKRHVWTAVSRVRELGTSVVLTSHSMEECEALCSRLAIMVNGRFRCIGSPQHLKNKFGEGYTIVAQLSYTGLKKRAEQYTEADRSALAWEMELTDLKTYIETEFPDCHLEDTHPGFVQYHVSVSSSVTWAKLFAVMEKAKDEFNLEAYSVGQTSLDQVFSNFTREIQKTTH